MHDMPDGQSQLASSAIERKTIMRFRLHYRGELRANGNPKHKWELRSIFHGQLKLLWQQEPLTGIGQYIDPSYRPSDCYLGISRGKRTFHPIVSERIWTIAELDILMLRPGDPGSIAVGGGDIDNRLKTLLDSLRVPDSTDSSKCPLPDDETNVFCLLQDDKLITRLAVETDRLLDPTAGKPNEVLLVVKVHVLASSGRFCNIGISL
jgi:hypothetical protein